MSVCNSLSDSRFKLYDRRGHNVLALLAVKILLSDLQLLFQYLLPHMRTDFLTVPGPLCQLNGCKRHVPKRNFRINHALPLFPADTRFQRAKASAIPTRPAAHDPCHVISKVPFFADNMWWIPIIMLMQSLCPFHRLLPALHSL